MSIHEVDDYIVAHVDFMYLDLGLEAIEFRKIGVFIEEERRRARYFTRIFARWGPHKVHINYSVLAGKYLMKQSPFSMITDTLPDNSTDSEYPKDLQGEEEEEALSNRHRSLGCSILSPNILSRKKTPFDFLFVSRCCTGNRVFHSPCVDCKRRTYTVS